jgi:hypothetical protein
VFPGPVKSPNEPFSGSGDLDGDGWTNADEYNGVLSWGGDGEDFLQSALDPEWDGQHSLETSTGVERWQRYE